MSIDRNQNSDQRALYDLCGLLFSILRSDASPARNAAVIRSDRNQNQNQVTPAAVASLLLGISMSLMLGGSVTFIIGFMLMPWVLGLVMVLYFVGIVSSLSEFGKSILCSAGSSCHRFSKVPII